MNKPTKMMLMATLLNGNDQSKKSGDWSDKDRSTMNFERNYNYIGFNKRMDNNYRDTEMRRHDQEPYGNYDDSETRRRDEKRYMYDDRKAEYGDRRMDYDGMRGEHGERLGPMGNFPYIEGMPYGRGYDSPFNHYGSGMQGEQNYSMARSHHEYSDDKMTRQMADEWNSEMKNADGTKGGHWTLEQAKQVMAQKGITGDPVEMWVALNATYSDLSPVFKKHKIDTIDAYVDFARAFWLNDKDAVDNKLAEYYKHIVK